MDSAKPRPQIRSVRGAVEIVEDDDFAAQRVLTFETDLLHPKWERYKKTSNPVLALEVFMLAIQEGVYPPAETLRWLATGFLKWHDGCGKESLDSALGMNVGRGQVPYFKRLLLEERDEMLMLDMCRLTTLGATIAEAAAMVEKKLSDKDWNKTPHDIADLNAETLTSKYSISDHSCKTAFSIKKPPLNDPAWVSEWLGTFDAAYIPKTLKSRL